MPSKKKIDRAERKRIDAVTESILQQGNAGNLSKVYTGEVAPREMPLVPEDWKLAAGLAGGLGLAKAGSVASALSGVNNPIAKGLEAWGKYAMPSALLDNIGLSAASPYIDAAALSYWSSKGLNASKELAKEGNYASAIPLAAVSAIPFLQPISNAGKAAGDVAADVAKKGIIRNVSRNVGDIPEEALVPKTISAATKAQSADNLPFLEDVYRKVNYKPTLEEESLLNNIPVEIESNLPAAEELAAYDNLNLKDLAEVGRTRDWLKRFNQSFVRRYHYEPIPLSLSEEPESAEAAVKNLLRRHNRVVRGVSDFNDANNGIKGYEKYFLKRLMEREGFNPNSREDRLMFAATTYAPSLSGKGRSGIVSPLVEVLPDGTVRERVYHYRSGANFGAQNTSPGIDVLNPANVDEINSAIGTHYASNSIGTSQGYAYGKGKAAFLEYPFELGPDRELWQYEADFPVIRDNALLPFDDDRYRRFVAKQILGLRGESLPKIEGPKPIRWLPYVSPSKMDVTDIDNLLSMPMNDITNRERNAFARLKDARKYLKGMRDIRGNDIADYQRYLTDPEFYANITEDTFPGYALPADIKKKIGKFWLEQGAFGYNDRPTTVGDYINNRAVVEVLDRIGTPGFFRKGAGPYIRSEINGVKDRMYRSLFGKNDRSWIREGVKKNNELLGQIFEELNYNDDPEFRALISKIPQERYLDATMANNKKADSAFSHFISLGPVGKPAANFVDWADFNSFSPEEIGAVTRMHYGTGNNLLTRNTREDGGPLLLNPYAGGGKIHIKPSHRGKFTALLKRTGKPASWFKAHGTPAQKKMATFALNARKWKHEDGGPLNLYPSGGKFITTLSPEREEAFMKDWQAYANLNKLDMNPDNPEHYYDYRGFWDANKKSSVANPFIWETKSTAGHLPDTWKTPGHPTFSVESVYAKQAPGLAGTWEDGIYIPPVKVDQDTIRLRQRYAESAFNDKAKSGAGALGAYQIMPETAKEYARRMKVEGDLLDASYNELMRDYIWDDFYNSELASKGDPLDTVRTAKALAMYNWGRGNLANYLNKQKASGADIYGSLDWVEGLPKETRDYINFILLNKDVADTSKTQAAFEAAAQKYGYEIPAPIDQHKLAKAYGMLQKAYGGDLNRMREALKSRKK